MKEISDELYDKLVKVGIINDKKDNTRIYNVGDSDYAQHLIQPYTVWIDWNLNPWDADIVKRVSRHKQSQPRIEDYMKIKHICDECIRQINVGVYKQ